jgi:hypothetical protein
MPYKMTVDVPTLGSQYLEIPGLGLFQNGTYDITDEEAASFQSSQPMVDEGGFDLDPDSPTHGSYIAKLVPGRDLMAAGEVMHGITVEEVTEGGSTSGTGTTPPASGTITKEVDPTGGTDAGTPGTTTGPVANLSLGPATDRTGGN